MIKIISLCDNINDDKKLWASEGNCTLISCGSVKILYDVGRDKEILLHNLKIVGVSPTEIDYVVLSHGHKGHSGAAKGGLSEFINAKILYGEHFLYPKFKIKNGDYSAVGNANLVTAVSDRSRMTEVSDYAELVKGLIYVFTVPLSNDVPFAEKYVIKKDGRYTVDEFKDELALCINTSAGLLVFSGCAHRGVLNTVVRAQKLTDNEVVRAVIGGTHILNDKRLAEKYCREMLDLDVGSVCPSHCTGYLGRAYISEIMKDKYIYFSTGRELVFDD